MKCYICGKQMATLHIEEIIGENTYQLHVCKECASKNDIFERYIELNCQNMESKTSFMEIKTKKLSPKKNNKLYTNVICKNCGYCISEFYDVHMLSCPSCYENFKPYLKKIVNKIHGAKKHIGKTPNKKKNVIEKENQKINLENKLNELIKLEEYEKAALIRDNIKNLEEEIASKDLGEKEHNVRK